eukprot:TRINITY_DN1974_c0_g2_i1.p1 TRINITY_DN1974_c0_g2~~TRINITY_DN1974_c0_g2_i1.p1  ORF type:complete len:134 (-),score=33.29 TRINITY_DN1974_c0_g2_i1:136-537(-)
MLEFYAVLAVLIVELVLLLLLLVPFVPDVVVETLIALLQTRGIKITFGILTLFTGDQTFKMYKEENRVVPLGTTNPVDATRFREQRFRAERNFYLCAFTYAMFIIIVRTAYMLKQNIKTRQELAELRARTKAQ